MELTAKSKIKRTAPRVPCKELNFQFTKRTEDKGGAKPINIKNFSVQISQKSSADNSFSMSPMRPSLPLYLVTPSNVSISTALQMRIKSRSNSKTQEKTKTPRNTFFSRNQEWKNDSNKRILRLKQEKDLFEISQCTFAPNLQKSTEKSRLSSRRGSGFRELFCTKDEKVVKEKLKDGKGSEFETRTYDFRGKSAMEDDIEESFLRVTRVLDSISKQIVETIEAEERV